MEEGQGGIDEASRQQQMMLELERKVRRWKWCVAGFAVVLVGIYTYYFRIRLGQGASTDAGTWGAFGDFVGGLVNPVVAFAAFFWLTESVKIQKQELADTRRELGKTTDAQNLLVKNGRVSVRLAAITALLNASNMNLDLIRQKMIILDGQIQDEDRKWDEDMKGKENLAGEGRASNNRPMDTKSRQQKSELSLRIKALEERVEDLQGMIEKELASSAA